MLKQHDNETVTRTGKGTPLGDAMRRYWMPALLAEELPAPDCPPVRVGLLGEKLVAFRDTQGRVGLLDERCPHRTASLFFGRNEECGLRCVFHGWKFDINGDCQDVPNEPEPGASQMRKRVKAKAYPVREMGGVIWAYMGPPETMPPLTMQEWMKLPPGASYITKNLGEANYLQLLEGGFDSSHSSFLHRKLSWETGEDGTVTQVYRARSTAPKHDVVKTDFGLSYASLRAIPEKDANYVRVMQFVMPFHQMRPFEGTDNCPLVTGHFWVPIDDHSCWVYSWLYARDGRPLPPELIEKEEADTGRSPDYFIPGTYRFKQNRSNDYLIDRERQKTVNFTGIEGISTQDQAVQESMGLIADRSIEHLGSADIAIVTIRKLLLQAASDAEAGQAPLGSQLENIPLRAAEKLIPIAAQWRDELASDMAAVL